MPKIRIARQITIKSPVDRVHKVLSDFKKWPTWSPWLIMEKGVKLEYAENGKSYEWDGKRVGSGRMTLTHSDPKSLRFDLQFLKPFRSKAKVGFDLKEDGKNTVVIWLMDTSLPFFMFWMVKQMTAFMSADYDRGLLMLKEYVEQGEVLSHMEEEGVVSYKGCQYVGVTTECTVDEMPSQMADDFKAISHWVDDEEMEINGEPFTIYHKMDRVKNEVAFTVGIPVEEFPDVIPSPYHQGKIPALNAFVILHEGPYHHLGNPWTLGYMMARNKEIKLRKGFPPFEVYLNNPQDTADELLETAIYFPVEN